MSLHQPNLSIRLTEKQQEAYKELESNSILLFGGGIRGAKSFFLIYMLCLYCFKFPKSRWIIMRKGMPDINRNLIPKFQTEFLDKGLRRFMYNWNLNTGVITWSNKSQLIFMSESFAGDKDLNRFRGLEINGGGCDEANEIQQETFTKLIERSGTWNNANITAPAEECVRRGYLEDGSIAPKLILTCNPAHNWVKTLFYDPWRAGKLKQGWTFVPALIYDNPFIKKSLIDNYVVNMPDYQFDVFVKGNWDAKLEGVLFDSKDLKRFVKSDFEKITKLKDEKLEDSPETIFGYIDVADEGDDYLAMVIGKIINKVMYITDVIYTGENTDITIPLCASLANDSKADYIRIETNGQGSLFKKELEKEIRDGDERVIGVHNNQNKHTRIIVQYRWILNNCRFLAETEYSKESDYGKFMRNILTYLKADNNKEDDGIDALSGLCKFVRKFVPEQFEDEPKKDDNEPEG